MVATSTPIKVQGRSTQELPSALVALESSPVGESWACAEAAGRSGLSAGPEPLVLLLAEQAPDALTVRSGERHVLVEELSLNAARLVEAAGAQNREISALFSSEALVLLERGVME